MHRFYAARWVSMAGGASLPALVAINTGSTGEGINLIEVVTIGLSVLVALATSFVSVTRVGQRWRLDALTRDLLEREAWLAVVQADNYSSHEIDASFRLFVERVESILRDAEHGFYADVASVVDHQTLSTATSDGEVHRTGEDRSG